AARAGTPRTGCAGTARPTRCRHGAGTRSRTRHGRNGPPGRRRRAGRRSPHQRTGPVRCAVAADRRTPPHPPGGIEASRSRQTDRHSRPTRLPGTGRRPLLVVVVTVRIWLRSQVLVVGVHPARLAGGLALGRRYPRRRALDPVVGAAGTRYEILTRVQRR